MPNQKVTLFALYFTFKAHEMATFYLQHPSIQTLNETLSMNLVNKYLIQFSRLFKFITFSPSKIY